MRSHLPFVGDFLGTTIGRIVCDFQCHLLGNQYSYNSELGCKIYNVILFVDCRNCSKLESCLQMHEILLDELV